MSSYQTLFDMIGVLARRRYQTAERYFARLGLNHTEARMLTLLHRESDEATQDTLSGMLTIDRSNAGRALKRLELEGYVTRRKEGSDKRTNLVQMTDKGRLVVDEIAKLRQQMADRFFGELTEEQAGAVVQLLQKALKSEEQTGGSDPLNIPKGLEVEA